MGKQKQAKERRAADQTLVLGRQARDMVSGWTGWLVAEYRYLNGCRRFEVSGVDDNGNPKGFVFDEAQLEVLAGERMVLGERDDTHGLVAADLLPPEADAETGEGFEPVVVEYPAMGAAASMPVSDPVSRRRWRRTGGSQDSTPVER